jgi:hypothetical protein
MMRLPNRNRDLLRIAVRRDALRILGFFLWISIWIGGAILYNAEHQSYPDQFRIIGWRLVFLIAAALVSGALIFRIWRVFGARFTEGIVESSSLSHSYSASADPGGHSDYDFRLNTRIRLRKPDGKCKTLCFEQKQGFYHYYYEGKPLLSIRGLPYPIRTDSDPSVGFVCAVCGTWHESGATACTRCGRSMIDPEELESAHSQKSVKKT